MSEKESAKCTLKDENGKKVTYVLKKIKGMYVFSREEDFNVDSMTLSELDSKAFCILHKILSK